MSGDTPCLCSADQLDADPGKLAANTVPCPHLPFVTPSFTPLASQASQPVPGPDGAPRSPPQMVAAQNTMATCDPRPGRYLTGAATIGNRVSMKDGPKQMPNIPNKNSSYFVEWIPNNIGTAVWDTPSPGC
ncbi:hypothetical protein GH733_005248 [Mirounga leonina]|nr:hypothetical protein GH733_005248 [Mirounga leonina]